MNNLEAILGIAIIVVGTYTLLSLGQVWLDMRDELNHYKGYDENGQRK